MRINVYAEELTSETEIVRKTVNQQLFYGVRVFLHSAKELHQRLSDDDRSAITFWVPFTVKHGNRPQVVIDALRNMLNKVILEAIKNKDSFIFQEDILYKGINEHENIK